MLNDKIIKKILTANLILNETDYKKYLQKAEKLKQPILDYLINKKILDEELIFQNIAKSLQLPYIDLKGKNIRQDILFLIPEPIAASHELIAFDKEKEILKIACCYDPDDLQTLEFIKKKTGMAYEIYLASKTSIKSVLKQYHQSIESEFKNLGAETNLSSDDSDIKLKELAQDLPVVRIVNTLLEYAIFEGASDIHIEPLEKELVIRYRIDGILHQVMSLPKNLQPGIAARIKILANLKLDEHRLPQDGRFKIEMKDYKISFRVSTLPVFDGEKIVLRLLNENSQLLNLEDLGLAGYDLKKLKQAIKKPHGMILVTGPTGSGKTTSLYAILNTLNTSKINISTIEDPIEYRMPHINQSQTNTKIGFTFANGLKSLLRQDPDIIMVGEIRDLETAEIAINSAMTGHLVLSTLHTNEAAGTLPRLLDMGLVSFLIASTTNIIIAQRLVRKICKNCIMSFTLDEKTAQNLNENFNIAELMKIMENTGAINISLTKQKFSSFLFFKGKGCHKCANTGYKGRIGIYEILEITPEIINLILKRASTSEIKQKAIAQGMVTMTQDGFIKAKAGITTIEEVLRVTKE